FMSENSGSLERQRQTNPLLFQAFTLGSQTFPGIWRSMMPKELLDLTFPHERRATCSSCPKACYAGFRPDYRCCTYHPRVANFLLGLATATERGDAAFDRALQRGLLLPEGFYAAPAQWIDFMRDQAEDLYGKSSRVLCPLLDTASGLCDIHAFRNAVCSTFFCYNDHGEAGSLFWTQLQTLGSQVEMILSQWALRRVGFDVDRYIHELDRMVEDLALVSTQEGWSARALQRLWGDWHGRERQLYRSCAEVILDHQHELWNLAQITPVREAALFEQAVDRLLPQDLRDDEQEELGHPSDLDPAFSWKLCLSAYQKLWRWPEGKRLILDQTVSITENGRKTPRELYAADQPFILIYQGESGEEWQALTADQRDVLERFSGVGTVLDDKIFLGFEVDEHAGLRTLISECLARQILHFAD
ncbi:MAG: hypothetical protein ACOVS5_09125, partial [Oligoflexus sp.]